jgi:predicted ferric reductase
MNYENKVSSLRSFEITVPIMSFYNDLINLLGVLSTFFVIVQITRGATNYALQVHELRQVASVV